VAVTAAGQHIRFALYGVSLHRKQVQMKYLSLLVLAIALFLTGQAQQRAGGADSLLQFMAANKKKASLYLVKNDTVVAKLNESVPMPLASTVKIMVAIEFAKQAASDIINERSKVALKELDKYYLPNTDGDAHPDWLQYEKEQGHIHQDSVALIDVARGMILFSSNANTEYLMDLLGLDNVKNNVQLFGLQQHTAIYPVVSSLFMYQNPRRLKEDKILRSIKEMPEEMYCKAIAMIHNQLKYDSGFKAKFRLQDLSLKMQKVWSDRLTASTTKEYAQICKILNTRKFMEPNAYGILAEILETAMENPLNQKWLKHTGSKGGSTAWVLTQAMYATTKKDMRIELAYFFNDLSLQDNERLQNWMNDFELAILTSETFRQRVKAAL
jgi:D-alanyl-D-alanine carboxypeptidase